MASDILLTKLHPPQLPPFWVPRAGLVRVLDSGQGSLMLVSAPAGYGKSVSVAAWLASREEPSAWLSLDPGDGDPGTFLAYLVAAVRTMFPEACPETQALLEAPELPPGPVLVRSLANELEAIETPFVLVLDDYHVIEGTAVHDLLSELIAHPPQWLRLVVITRRDPPLPLASLRGQGRVTEVRAVDLQFERSESERLLQKHGLSVSARSLDRLQEVLEGWPVALHLLALALGKREDPDAFALSLGGPIYEVQEYLVREVLADLSPAAQRWLFETSILDRFCASACDAVCSSATHALDPGLDGEAFLEMLRLRSLFVIPLDERGEWYRYHHTFQESLRESLGRECSAEEIAALHSRAARWLDENDDHGMALDHALKARDEERAMSLVRRNATGFVDQQQWTRLDRWLARLPRTSVDQDPALLVANAWASEYRSSSGAEEHLEQAEKQLVANPPASPEREMIQAEIAALRALHHYALSRPREALSAAQRALAVLSPNTSGMGTYALIISALAHQSSGDGEVGLTSLFDALNSHSVSPASRSLLLTGLSFASWLEGDLTSMKRSALQIVACGEEHGLRSSIAYGRYLLGILHYMRDERAEARRNLEALVDERFFASQNEYGHGSLALALVHLSDGRPEEAQAVFESIYDHALASGNARIIRLVTAFRAETDLRQGHAARAASWAKSCSPEPLRDLYMFYIPQLTLIKAQLAEASPESRAKAADLSKRMLEWAPLVRNVPLRIQALALWALMRAADGDEPAALESLTEAIELAAPGGFVRPFADLGAPMKSLLERLPRAVGASEHVALILTALGAKTLAQGSGPRAATTAVSDGAGPLVEPLTNRELDVLELLAARLRDKEIAERLFISPVTVKSHLKGLYRKLDVGDRREAVASARKLGILDVA